MKKIAILQSNYIPWKGYFDIINSVDEFIIYDHVQYTKNDWRNRNKIKTKNGLQWLTIPVSVKSLNQRINETVVSDFRWNVKHWKSISQSYSRSRHFSVYGNFFKSLYLDLETELCYLSDINYKFITAINDILEIDTKITFSTDYSLAKNKNNNVNIIELCLQANADIYLSGPSAKNYIDENLFKQNKITIEWVDYNGYRSYPQLHGEFEHGVSILDLIFNVGPETLKYLKSFVTNDE